MGTKIADLMTTRPRAVQPQTPVTEAAQLMELEDIGSLPVVDEGSHLVGIVTDRDIALRVVAAGLDPQATCVGDVASRDVVALTPDHDLDDALNLMAREQVRRLPVVVDENELVGVIAQADIALTAKERSTGEVVEAISEPPAGPRLGVPTSSGRDDDDREAERPLR